jgi:hypothetical protein
LPPVFAAAVIRDRHAIDLVPQAALTHHLTSLHTLMQTYPTQKPPTAQGRTYKYQGNITVHHNTTHYTFQALKYANLTTHRMFTSEAAQPQPDTWLLEDIQIRKVVRLNPPVEDPATTKNLPTRTKVSNGHTYIDIRTDMDVLEKEHTALRLAMDLSRLEEEGRVAVKEQERMERTFREGRKNKVKDFKGRGMETGGGYGYIGKDERRVLEVEKERIAQEMLEREKAAALRRAVEEELYTVRKERVLREQMDRERELKREEEARRERVRRDTEAKVQREREREVLKKVKELELEEAAVARAVEESIITEAARRLLDKEKERKRVEEMADRMRREAEERAQEERLRRRVEGRKAYAGIKTTGLALSTDDVRALVEPYLPTGEYHPTTYTGGHKGRQDAITNPTWYGYAPPLTPRSPRPDKTAADLRWRGYELDLDRVDEIDTTGWRKPGKDGRRWRETTTERWETVIHREGEGHDGYRRSKETTKLIKRFG